MGDRSRWPGGEPTKLSQSCPLGQGGPQTQISAVGVPRGAEPQQEPLWKSNGMNNGGPWPDLRSLKWIREVDELLFPTRTLPALIAGS